MARRVKQFPGKRQPGLVFSQPETDQNSLSYDVHASAILAPSDSPLQEIFKGLIEFPGIEIYVHGSWADDSKTPFSDLDDLIIVDVDSIESAGLTGKLISRLNRVDMRLCRMDPTQHHGHWMIETKDLQQYDESYMPLLVLEDALCLQGRENISASAVTESTQRGLRRNLEIALNHVSNSHEKYSRGKINIYEMKTFIGSIMLTPAYVFQIRGERVSKRHAIENANTIYGQEALAAIECCSSIRRDWGKAIGGWQFKLLQFSTHIISNPHIYRRFAAKASPIFPKERFPQLETRDVEAFIAQSRALADE